MHRRRSSERGRKVTPPSPIYMDNDQFAAYLADLRNNRVTRPGGARPLPPSSRLQAKDTVSTTSSSQFPGAAQQTASNTEIPRVQVSSEPLQPRFPSTSSRHSTASVASDSRHSILSPQAPLKPSEVVPSATYMERGQRWMEREEVGSLRQAMRVMNITHAQPGDADGQAAKRVYNAALDEAAELVWQHRHGNGRQPDPHAPYRYKPHMRKNSYQQARAASIGKRAGESDVANAAIIEGDTATTKSRASMDSELTYVRDGRSLDHSRNPASRSNQTLGTKERYGGLVSDTMPPTSTKARRSSTKRNISGEIEQPFSGDQIWEEPEVKREAFEAQQSDMTLVDKLRNPQSRNRSVFDKPQGHVSPFKARSIVEIHRNPPSQSHDPQYTTNTPPVSVVGESQIQTKNGVEIRGEDIRDATSMKLKDRSTKLPVPSAVSDNPDRPIVSFDADWKPPEETTDRKSGSVHARSLAERFPPGNPAMVIPTIVVAEEAEKNPTCPKAPTIIVQEAHISAGAFPSIPVITAPDDYDSNGGGSGIKNGTSPGSNGVTRSARPLPSPTASSRRNVPAKGAKGHWSPSPGNDSRSATQCHECGFTIEGRYVALAGISERFHPRCFSCYSCGTGLEALEISPEPEAARNERLDRIQCRANGDVLEEIPGKTIAEDGDERLRFYCHLDWHELFAPRCKHCKTPILGEHIVALGEHWHYGHFFCAECGDPFEQGMTHIEKDGYAWCVNCQTKRTERRAPKCKMCGIAVIGQYLRALGGEWHEECFRCAHCQGGFDDGQIFPKEEQGRMVVLCTGCRMTELKA